MSVITRGLQLKTFGVDFRTVDQLRIDIAIVNALNVLTFIYFRPICLYSFNQEIKIIQIRNFTRIQKNTYNSIAVIFEFSRFGLIPSIVCKGYNPTL